MSTAFATQNEASQCETAVCPAMVIGPARLLPADRRLLCSCAGLFFAQVLRIDGEQVWLEVAALPHYFHADETRRQRHVRTIMLPAERRAQLLEWDRRLAGMATCDVRDLVEEHAARVGRTLTLPISEALSGTPEHLDERSKAAAVPHALGGWKQVAQSGAAFKQRSREAGGRHRRLVPDADQVGFAPEREQVMVPLSVFRELVPVDQRWHHVSSTQVNRLLMRAALRQLRQEMEREENRKRYSALRNKARRIERLFRLRGKVPMRKLVEFTPLYEQGKRRKITAYRVDIDVLAA